MDWQDVLDALLGTNDPPTNYALTTSDVEQVAVTFDWMGRWVEDGDGYDDLADMVKAEPEDFLEDISRHYGDDYYLQTSEDDWDDPMDGDAESALASAGFGTNEDYGCYE